MNYRVTNIGGAPLSIYTRHADGLQAVHLAKLGDVRSVELTEARATLLEKFGAARFEKIEPVASGAAPAAVRPARDKQRPSDLSPTAPSGSLEGASNSKGEL